MVQKLVVYPDPRINSTSTDVRTFNQTLWDILQDMKDTMKEYNMDAMAAIQIAYPYNIIIIKEGDEYLELINPRGLTQSGKFDSTETTSYYPEIEVTISRDENMKIVYEDREGKPQHKNISDKTFAATLQRKIDYTFGGNFLDKLGKRERENILDHLKSNGLTPMPTEDVCPTSALPSDYLLSFTNKILIAMGLSLTAPLFSFSESTMTSIALFNKIGLFLVIGLIAGYFLLKQIESKKYGQCSSCQVGNDVGVIVKKISIAIVLAIAGYFILS